MKIGFESRNKDLRKPVLKVSLCELFYILDMRADTIKVRCGCA